MYKKISIKLFIDATKTIIMKKYILLALVFFTSVLTNAQSSFNEFETNEKVNAVVVNKKMFELMSKIKVDANDVQAQNYLALIKNLDYLRVLSTSDSGTSKLLLITVNNYLGQNILNELVRSVNSGKSVKIYVKGIDNTDLISELLMLVEDQQNKNTITVMTLTGNFSINSLSVLTEKMNLPGSKEIKELSKK
jgi:hypothetical protein